MPLRLARGGAYQHVPAADFGLGVLEADACVRLATETNGAKLLNLWQRLKIVGDALPTPLPLTSCSGVSIATIGWSFSLALGPPSSGLPLGTSARACLSRYPQRVNMRVFRNRSQFRVTIL